MEKSSCESIVRDVSYLIYYMGWTGKCKRSFEAGCGKFSWDTPVGDAALGVPQQSADSGSGMPWGRPPTAAI